MVTQPSALVNTLNAYVEQNDKILSRGAFYYYYAGAGIGRGDFAETRETVAQIAKDYQEIFMDTNEEENREDELE